MTTQNILAFGASSDIGYYASLRLLASGATVTFLLRSPSVFDMDEAIQSYVNSGMAQLIKGDCLVQEDVQRAWEGSGKKQPVDTVLFTVGSCGKCGIPKGPIIDPPNLVTQSLFNVLATMPKSSEQNSKLRLIVITSAGLTPKGYQSLPFPLRLLYSYHLTRPHKDKTGAERLIWHCAGKEWPKDIPEPGDDVMGPNWTYREGLPRYGSFTNSVIVRPYLSTDGECVADKVVAKEKGTQKPYRVGGDELSGYTISKRDVAHFIVEDTLKNWDQYQNTAVTVTY